MNNRYKIDHKKLADNGTFAFVTLDGRKGLNFQPAAKCAFQLYEDESTYNIENWQNRSNLRFAWLQL